MIAHELFEDNIRLQVPGKVFRESRRRLYDPNHTTSLGIVNHYQSYILDDMKNAQITEKP